MPEYPARNFREAIQSFWFIHLAIEVEQMACATSPGRYGQYMYPFYKKDIDEGKLTREQVITLLKFQWIKHMELGEYRAAPTPRRFPATPARPSPSAAWTPTAATPAPNWKNCCWKPRSECAAFSPR